MRLILLVVKRDGTHAPFQQGIRPLVTGLAPATGEPAAQGGRKVINGADRAGAGGTDPLDDGEPGPAGKQGDAGGHEAEQQQVGPDATKQRHHGGGDNVPHQTAGGEILQIIEVHAGDGGHAEHGQDETDDAHRQGEVVHIEQAARAPEQAPAKQHNQGGHQVGESPEGKHGDIGEPGPRAAGEVLNLPLPGGLGPTGIGGVVGQQGKQEIGSHQGDGDQDGFEDPLCT